MRSYRSATEALRRNHASVGQALFYTTLTVALGFSILALSNFVPTIHFGLLTGLAMVFMPGEVVVDLGSGGRAAAQAARCGAPVLARYHGRTSRAGG